MNNAAIQGVPAWAGVALLAVFIQGCVQSGTGGGRPTVRTSVETAPAALQLACAAEAARVYDVSADKVLPISSTAAGEGTYTVNVNAGDRRAACKIDNEGNVLSLVES